MRNLGVFPGPRERGVLCHQKKPSHLGTGTSVKKKKPSLKYRSEKGTEETVEASRGKKLTGREREAKKKKT